MPSLDRIDPHGPYSADNVRIVLLGINGLRGCGTDADMYRIARALIRNIRSVAASKGAATRARGMASRQPNRRSLGGNRTIGPGIA